VINAPPLATVLARPDSAPAIQTTPRDLRCFLVNQTDARRRGLSRRRGHASATNAGGCLFPLERISGEEFFSERPSGAQNLDGARNASPLFWVGGGSRHNIDPL